MGIETDPREAELRHVGLRDDHGAARPQPPHDRRVLCGGRCMREERRAGPRRLALNVEQILDADDRAVERAEGDFGVCACIGRIGLDARGFALGIADAGERRLEPVTGCTLLCQRNDRRAPATRCGAGTGAGRCAMRRAGGSVHAACPFGSAHAAPSPPFSSMKRAMASMPRPTLRSVNTNGRGPRMRLASRSMTSSEAPTCGARSILLMTRRSERVMPGPPLEGSLSAAATSMTYTVRSASSGENVAARLSPPDSISTRSSCGHFWRISAIAASLIP